MSIFVAEILLPMTTYTKFKEYIWLVNTIFKARRITFAEINERWIKTEMSGGVPMARATFNRHKDAIEDIFGIIIECDRQNGYKYYIDNEHVLREDSIQNWMLSTLSVNNIISESLSLQKRILLEPVPYEGNFLTTAIEAMKRSVRIAIKYRKYGDTQPRDLDFEPYCLKMFRQRWYVLGHFHREVLNEPPIDYFGMFSFDRILEMKLTDMKFKIDPDFDAEEYFSECYGVLVNEDTQAKRIVLRVYGFAQYYLEDLPLHHSQHEIGHGENYTDYELFLRPTPDFVSHLLSYGTQVKVLSPQWLADEVGQAHWEAAEMYSCERN